MKISNIIRILSLLVITAGFFGCLTDDDSKDTDTGTNPDTTTDPSGARVVFSDDFEGDLSKWEPDYLVVYGEPAFVPMDISTAAFHGGSKSVTCGAGETALVAKLDTNLGAGYVASAGKTVAGIEFYMMGSSAGTEKFSAVIGKNAGSSGGLGKQFGFGFDESGNVIATYYDQSLEVMDPNIDTVVAVMTPGKWHKCVVDLDFTAKIVTWKLDDAQVRTLPFPTVEFHGLDRVLIFDGMPGVQPYYVDDIKVYMK